MVIAICVIKLLTPRLKILPHVLNLSFKDFRSKRKFLKRGIYITETINDAICPIIVAIAAPLTPILNTNIKMGSKTVFIIAPKSMENIAKPALPSARIRAFNAVEIMVKGSPMPIIYPYCTAYSLKRGSVDGVAPNSVSIGFRNIRYTAISIKQITVTINVEFAAPFLRFRYLLRPF